MFPYRSHDRIPDRHRAALISSALSPTNIDLRQALGLSNECIREFRPPGQDNDLSLIRIPKIGIGLNSSGALGRASDLARGRQGDRFHTGSQQQGHAFAVAGGGKQVPGSIGIAVDLRRLYSSLLLLGNIWGDQILQRTIHAKIVTGRCIFGPVRRAI